MMRQAWAGRSLVAAATEVKRTGPSPRPQNGESPAKNRSSVLTITAVYIDSAWRNPSSVTAMRSGAATSPARPAITWDSSHSVTSSDPKAPCALPVGNFEWASSWPR